MTRSALALVFVLTAAPATTARAAELFVGGAGDPHSTIQSALDAAGDGDIVTVRDGTYGESLQTRADGVTLRAEAGATVVVEISGRVLRVEHARFTLEGITLDGMFGDRDALNVEDAGDDFTMRDSEVRNSGRDCVDMGSPSGVRILSSRIHHCLSTSASNCSSDGCRNDAHGITGAAVRDVLIRNTEIHTFSGDAIQFDPGRSDAGWSGVTLDGCTMWLAPLPSAVGGFAAGVVPGENAIDTKTSNNVVEPAELTIRNTTARGFRGGLISNMAAYNLKENVRALLDRVTVSDSEIAFRLRGQTGSRPRGALVTIRNAVVFDVDTAVRYEDQIEPVTIQNSTFGGDVCRHFQDASSGGRIDSGNMLVLGGSLPAELMGVGSNLATGAATFVDAAGHDYHLPDGSPAIDVGEALMEVVEDRDGNARPQGGAWDIGAYENCGAMCVEVDAGPGPPPDRDGGGVPGGDGGGSRRDGGGGSGADGGGSGPSDDGGCGCSTPGTPANPVPAILALSWLLRLVRPRQR